MRFARKWVLLLLHERLTGVPGLADLFAGDVVAVLELVENERVELRRIDLAVSIGSAEIGEGARLVEVLGIEGAAKQDESAFSSKDWSSASTTPPTARPRRPSRQQIRQPRSSCA